MYTRDLIGIWQSKQALSDRYDCCVELFIQTVLLLVSDGETLMMRWIDEQYVGFRDFFDKSRGFYYTASLLLYIS